MKELDLSDREHTNFLDKILEGDMVLFLGSGFSLGAISNYKDDTGNYVSIPSVNDLKHYLCTKVLRDESEENKRLSTICEYCQEDEPSDYKNFMQKIFNVREKEPFHDKYALFDWKRIYTLNVDNLLEQVFRDKDISIFYTDKPEKVGRGTLEIIKLHGDAYRNPEQITFSTSDYLTNVRLRDVRFEKLTNDLKTDNIMFLGTSLSDEIDFDLQCTYADVFSVSNKAYFVFPTCSSRQEKQLRRKFSNIVFIKENTESFINKLIDYERVRHKVKKNERINFKSYGLEPLSIYRHVSDDYLSPSIYQGMESTWDDIFTNHDIIWEDTQRKISDIIISNKSIIIIHGKRLAGKTVFFKRLAATLEDNGYLVYVKIGEDTIESFLKLFQEIKLASNKEFAVMVDDASWALGKIEELKSAISDLSNVKLVMVIRESEYYRKQHLFTGLIENDILTLKIDHSRFFISDIIKYLDKLHEKTFLGEYSKEYEKDKEKLAKKLLDEATGSHQDHLLYFFYRNKLSTSASKRIQPIVHSVIGSRNYNVKRFTVFLYLTDVLGDAETNLSLFLTLYPIEKEEVSLFVSDIQEILNINFDKNQMKRIEYKTIRIHARYHAILEEIIRKMKKEDIIDIYEDILRQLDNFYHTQIRKSATKLNHLLYVLIRSQTVTSIFQGRTNWNLIRKLYQDLRNSYDDYHLYWLHWAIAEMKSGEYDSAEIHLRDAEARRIGRSYEIEHSFAMLYFTRAIKEPISRKEKELYYQRAREIIQVQIKRKENDAFSIHSFVVKTIEYYRTIKQVMPRERILEVIKYYDLARQTFKLSQSTIRRNMLYCIFKYMKDNGLLFNDYLKLDLEEKDYIAKRMQDTVLELENVDVLDMIDGR
ncbi:MAG: SIR2 family protein [Butyrivibrio sp.]|nr:SIR2 family protein [Butyrivibrio sp.]